MTAATNSTLSQAIADHQQGRWQAAERGYLALLAENAHNADVLHLIGILYGQMGQWQPAKEYLDRVLALAPNNATYHNSLANVEKNLNNTDQAIHHYQEAIKLNPHSTTAYSNLAAVFLRLGQFAEAKAMAERALTVNPQEAESHYTMAVIALKHHDSNQAITHLRQTLDLNPQHVQARYTLAQQLHNRDPSELAEAISHYQAVLKAQPQFTDALVNYAAALLTQNQRELALKTFYQALEIDPDHYEAHYNLGCALLEQQQLPVALEHFIKAIHKKPTPEAYYNIGVLYSYQDRHGDAISYLKKAIEFDPQYFAAYNNLGTVYLKIDNKPEAINSFAAALAIQPDNDEIAYILAALKQQQTPERAPKGYVEHLFDQYAPHFDKHLLEHLKYATPNALHEAVMTVIRDNLHCRPVLDLGCGTGLAGALFKDIAAPLIGVDLSSQMIAILKEKNLYDQLIVGDIEDALRTQLNNELIIAADVLPYLGNLSTLFTAVKHALIPGGLFAFSIEIGTDSEAPYSLQTSVRYAHSPQYIEQLAEQHGLALVHQQVLTLRLQHNKPLPGKIYILQHPPVVTH